MMIAPYNTYSCWGGTTTDQDEFVPRDVFAEADSDEEYLSDNEYEVNYVWIFLYMLDLRILSCAV